MVKARLVSVFWSVAIAIPFAALAIMASAFITENLIEISNGLRTWFQSVFLIKRNLLFEVEIVSLITGQLILLAILVLTWITNNKVTSNQK